MRRLSIVFAVAVGACGDDGNGKAIDASASDGPTSSGDGAIDASDQPADAASDAPSPVAVGPACGATVCTNVTEECCIGVSNVCRAAGTCPSQGFACDGPEDCETGRCCYPNNNGSRCSTVSNCQVACHSDMDCPSTAPSCCPAMFTPEGYGVCQTAC